MPTSSIVIVNRNGGPVLAECIDSIRRNTSDYEILLIDNGSTDGSMDSVKGGLDLHSFRLASNRGHPIASNLGIRASQGRYIVMLDPDTTFTTGWLDKLIDEANKSPNIGVVAPKLLRPGNFPILDSTGHIFQYQTGRSMDRGQGELDTGQYDSDAELPSCCFACTLIKKRVFEDIGMPDPHLFSILSDVDFGLRASLAGWRVVYRPDSNVYHIRGGSTREGIKDRVDYQSSAYQLHMILKIYQPRSALLLGGRIFLMYFVRIATGIKKRDLTYSKGYIRATLWTLLHLPLRERVHFQRRRRVSDERLLPKRSQYGKGDQFHSLSFSKP